jgi:hypothetical protein
MRSSALTLAAQAGQVGDTIDVLQDGLAELGNFSLRTRA